MLIVPATTTSDIARAAGLFDRELRPEAVERFAADPDHHLLLAVEGDAVVGFVSGVEMTHPDKGPEMFVYELGVDPEARNRVSADRWWPRWPRSRAIEAVTACGS